VFDSLLEFVGGSPWAYSAIFAIVTVDPFFALVPGETSVITGAMLAARRLDELREAARGTDNLMHPIRQALMDRCSMGEVCGAMKDVFGAYRPRT